ncbi:rhomboid family intramembrane serine protease [Chryseolinea lacunae]|uniref:Rhomboid family intramembrane serine protease n=1 Tax=Chryseolinea lacunae TaxID=2801331 RepID=A0ABS1L126_9BACT|nr:rhomboid family intramembrane serine protease [Chryseolinea lacunae]MBL0745391.1 rhomboid family intramembrane serine protease [Chryseolinea lacunae]
MKDYNLKFRHILPTFLYISLGSIVLLSLLHYFTSIQFELIKEDIWAIWAPIAFPWIPITIWLRPKLRVLIFRKETDRRRFLFQFIAWVTMTATLLISQEYVTTATGKLLSVNTVEDIERLPKERYYTLKNFEVAVPGGGMYADFSTSGKNNQNFDMALFFAFPIVKDSSQQKIKNHSCWYGVKFRKQISNRLEPEEKEKIYTDFHATCMDELKNYNFSDVTYFERLPKSKDREDFQAAVARALDTQTAEDSIILKPQHNSFAERTGNKLAWIFGSYGIGLVIFLLVLLWPRFSKLELERQREGKKPKEDDVKEMFQYLIPRSPHFATSIIIDLNILVFVAMMFAGVNILSPSGADLLAWGANRRYETVNGDWWRLLTSMFLHGGIMHLLLNIYGLVLAATFLEPTLGPRRYAVLYIVAGLAGSIASMVWYTNTLSVGASGAIFGLHGAILSLLLTDAYRGSKRLILILIGIYVSINLVMGLAGGVDNAAHVGGLVSGAILGFVLYYFKDDKGPIETIDEPMNEESEEPEESMN